MPSAGAPPVTAQGSRIRPGWPAGPAAGAEGEHEAVQDLMGDLRVDGAAALRTCATQAAGRRRRCRAACSADIPCAAWAWTAPRRDVQRGRRSRPRQVPVILQREHLALAGRQVVQRRRDVGLLPHSESPAFGTWQVRRRRYAVLRRRHGTASSPRPPPADKFPRVRAVHLLQCRPAPEKQRRELPLPGGGRSFRSPVPCRLDQGQPAVLELGRSAAGSDQCEERGRVVQAATACCGDEPGQCPRDAGERITARDDFRTGYDRREVTCPQGQVSKGWRGPLPTSSPQSPRSSWHALPRASASPAPPACATSGDGQAHRGFPRAEALRTADPQPHRPARSRPAQALRSAVRRRGHRLRARPRPRQAPLPLPGIAQGPPAACPDRHRGWHRTPQPAPLGESTSPRPPTAFQDYLDQHHIKRLRSWRAVS